MTASRVVHVPRAPDAIARDPERLEMWERAFTAVKDPRARQTIAVSGCGERSTYACWDWVGDQPGRRGRRRHLYVGTSCLEAAGEAPALSAESTTPGSR